MNDDNKLRLEPKAFIFFRNLHVMVYSDKLL